jgi:CubicO group peptidase (beta-lactamase class C family)
VSYIDADDGYPTASLDELGLDPGKVDDLIARAQKEIDGTPMPSSQLAVARDGKVGVFRTLGDATPTSRYVMFSCSKAVVGAAVWMLLGEGVIAREQKVADLLPGFGQNGKDVITIEQLLTHTSGFPRAPMGAPVWSDRKRRLDHYAGWRTNWEPGSRFEYHPTSAHWVLADIVEAVTETDYRNFIRARISDPIGIRLRVGLPPEEENDVNDLVFYGEPPNEEQLQELGIPAWDPGEVIAENLDQLSKQPALAIGVPGGGAIATAADLAIFYQALLHNEPELWEPEVLRQATAEVIFDTDDQLLGIPANRTLGITLAGDDGKTALRGFGYTVSGRAFGHGGAGGQIAWADPETGISFAYLTNGYDEYVPHHWRRTAGLSSRAGELAG